MLISSLSGSSVVASRRDRSRSCGLARSRFCNLHYTIIWGALVLATLSFTGIFIAFPDGPRRCSGIRHGLPRQWYPRAGGHGRPMPDEAAAVKGEYPTRRLSGWISGYPRGVI
jgi:hypothetical protein